MSEPRFLVVRLGSLGDIVHTFPAVAGLRNSFPRAEIIWLTHPRWVNLVASSRLATEIWPVNSRDLASVRQSIAKIRAQRWDAAVDYQGLWKSALLPFLAGIPKRIGFSAEAIREFGVPILYTDRVHPRSAHIADQNGELSLRAGAQTGVCPVKLQVGESDRQRVSSDLADAGINNYIVLSPGGGWRSKCWPAERFGELCRKTLEELNVRCVINFGPGEETLAAAVKSASGNANPFLYDGELGQLMALLQGAQCIVGGDTGPLHLAIALGTKAVAIFGPTNPARNGPYPPQPFVLRDPAASTTHKRETQTNPSLLKISVEQVFDAVKLHLGVSA
ncbi:MAG TPA: glycosyltransferase family 9 protein [Candidatus Sulfotelmatobacter sp.]|jgi:heptosyltransferase-1|nr:glycosyltransferase family 9 protein [Candidatus Sulfotelmatobacter sp.]